MSQTCLWVSSLFISGTSNLPAAWKGLRALFAVSLPWDTAALLHYAKPSWQPACVRCQASGSMWVYVCTCADLLTHTPVSKFTRAGDRKGFGRFALRLCAHFMPLSNTHTHRRTLALRQHKSGEWILIPPLLALISSWLVKSAKVRIVSEQDTRHRSAHETQWHLSSQLTLKSCYTPPPALPGLPLATDKNGEVEGSVVGKGVGFIDPLSLSARRPAGEVRGQRAGCDARRGDGGRWGKSAWLAFVLQMSMFPRPCG